MNIPKDCEIVFKDNYYRFCSDYSGEKIRCVISYFTVSDYFYNNARDEAGAIKAIQKNWGIIWSAFQNKIKNGEVELIQHDNGQMYTPRYQKIYQVELEPKDFGSRDFRNAA